MSSSVTIRRHCLLRPRDGHSLTTVAHHTSPYCPQLLWREYCWLAKTCRCDTTLTLTGVWLSCTLYTVHLYICTHVHDINSDRCLTVLEEVVWSTCRVMVVVLPLQLKVISSPGWADISHLSTTLVLSATVYSNWVRLLHVGGSEVWKINGAIHFSPNLKLKLRNPKIAF